MMTFKNKDKRNNWIHSMDRKYRKKMSDKELQYNEGIVFPEKKPTTKTGTIVVTELDEVIIQELVPLMAGDYWQLGVKKMDKYEEIGDKYGLSADAIRKKASKFKKIIDARVKIHNE